MQTPRKSHQAAPKTAYLAPETAPKTAAPEPYPLPPIAPPGLSPAVQEAHATAEDMTARLRAATARRVEVNRRLAAAADPRQRPSGGAASPAVEEAARKLLAGETPEPPPPDEDEAALRREVARLEHEERVYQRAAEIAREEGKAARKAAEGRVAAAVVPWSRGEAKRLAAALAGLVASGDRIEAAGRRLNDAGVSRKHSPLEAVGVLKSAYDLARKLVASGLVGAEEIPFAVPPEEPEQQPDLPGRFAPIGEAAHAR